MEPQTLADRMVECAQALREVPAGTVVQRLIIDHMGAAAWIEPPADSSPLRGDKVDLYSRTLMQNSRQDTFIVRDRARRFSLMWIETVAMARRGRR
jgi:hypothetical protein